MSQWVAKPVTLGFVIVIKAKSRKLSWISMNTGAIPDPAGRGGGNLHMKGVGMPVVSLRGVNFGFWSHLGYSGQNAIIFSREGLV